MTLTLETIRYEVDAGVAWITMNRPEARNAESLLLIDERTEAFREAERDDDVRVIVLCGAGSSFCAGHDLKEIRNDAQMIEQRSTMEGRYAIEEEYYLRRSLLIRDTVKPTVAMVQGACIAGGLMTAAMCDLIIAAEGAIFADPVLGMTEKGAAAVEVLFHPWQLGVRKAKEFLLLGEPMSAAEAKECGFVNRVVPADQLLAETRAIAERIASLPPRAVAMTKKSINAMLDRQGQLDSFKYHFLMHQLSHSPD